MAKRKRFELRLSDDQLTAMKRTAQSRGFRSASAYVHAALSKDLRDSAPDEAEREAFVAAVLTGCRKRFAHSTRLTRPSLH